MHLHTFIRIRKAAPSRCRMKGVEVCCTEIALFVPVGATRARPTANIFDATIIVVDYDRARHLDQPRTSKRLVSA